MNRPLAIPFDRVRPPAAAVLEDQGIPPGVEPGTRVMDLCRRAVDLLRDDAVVQGVVREISVDEFAEVFRGAGQNAPEAPLKQVFPRATRLALFAVTLGPAVVERINELFAGRDYPLGAMLDSAASEATERAGEAVVEEFNREAPAPAGGAGPGSGHPAGAEAVLRYSPGYCGWHMSGQRALFDFLAPERIGITLRPTFIMEPLKSMTGVIVSGPAEIHRFDPDFPFCAECVSHSCRRRMQEAVDHRS